MYPDDPNIVALIGDAAEPSAHLPHASIDDIAAAADLVLAHAKPLAEVLAEFEGGRRRRTFAVLRGPFDDATMRRRDGTGSNDERRRGAGIKPAKIV